MRERTGKEIQLRETIMFSLSQLDHNNHHGIVMNAGRNAEAWLKLMGSPDYILEEREGRMVGEFHGIRVFCDVTIPQNEIRFKDLTGATIGTIQNVVTP